MIHIDKYLHIILVIQSFNIGFQYDEILSYRGNTFIPSVQNLASSISLLINRNILSFCCNWYLTNVLSSNDIWLSSMNQKLYV